MRSRIRLVPVAALLALSWGTLGESLTPRLTFEAGPINSAVIRGDDESIAIYRVPSNAPSDRSFQVWLTHARRDVSSGATRLPAGTPITAPEAERILLESPRRYWREFTKKRFHDYDQQSTKILPIRVPVTRWVKAGDLLPGNDVEFRVLATPGYTRGAISYVARIDGKNVAFTGDLIYGDGKIFDLYSFQDAIPEAKIRGYHGYGGRLAALIESLELIKKTNPDLIVPARGPIIREPIPSIDRLIERVRALYANYLSTNALNWYFKEERMRISGERVLGSGAPIELMSYSAHTETPAWVKGFSTSRLLISDDGFAFLLDCGNERVIEEVQTLITSGLIERVEGIFVTHFHDDHTDYVQRAAELFKCPVYALTAYEDVLEKPEAYHLPAMTANAIEDVIGVNDGDSMRWREFKMRFHFYPGQAYHHGALWVEKPGETPIFFIGDSFSPSGIDDYCVLNRNLVHEDTGYFRCLRMLRELPGDYWLINEHIPYVFRFSDAELTYLETRYLERKTMLSELFPWDDPNYGIDEQWAVFYPYGAKLSPGETREFELRLTNHSPVRRTFKVVPRGWAGVQVETGEVKVSVPSRGSMPVPVSIQAPNQVGVYLITADIESEGMWFQDWVEALLEVE